MSLKIDNLSVAYQSLRGDVQAVDGVSLSIGDGEIMGLAGSPAVASPPWATA